MTQPEACQDFSGKLAGDFSCTECGWLWSQHPCPACGQLPAVQPTSVELHALQERARERKEAVDEILAICLGTQAALLETTKLKLVSDNIDRIAELARRCG